MSTCSRNLRNKDVDTLRLTTCPPLPTGNASVMVDCSVRVMLSYVVNLYVKIMLTRKFKK